MLKRTLLNNSLQLGKNIPALGLLNPMSFTPKFNYSKAVFDFDEGNADMKFLLGGKGANLCEMTNLGIPVPPGFILSVDACTKY